MTRTHSSQTFPLRGALIGFGNVARYAHLPLWENTDYVTIDAVIEPLAEHVMLARELLPNARLYSDLKPLLEAPDLDFVDICTPPCFHAALVLEASRSGLHVLCEKPLATSLESLYQLAKAAGKSRTVIFTVNNWKHAPLWAKALELIRANKIGAVRFISLSVLRPPSCGGSATEWRRCADIAGGGILLDHGWHHLYLILSIMREEPRFISAALEHSETHGPRMEERADLAIKFDQAEAQLHLTWCASCRKNYGTITGDRGVLHINDDHLLLETAGSSTIRYNFPEPLSGGSHHVAWMRPVIQEFLREICDVSARGTNFQEAYWCAQLVHAAYQSHREGGRFITVEGSLIQESLCL